MSGRDPQRILTSHLLAGGADWQQHHLAMAPSQVVTSHGCTGAGVNSLQIKRNAQVSGKPDCPSHKCDRDTHACTAVLIKHQLSTENWRQNVCWWCTSAPCGTLSLQQQDEAVDGQPRPSLPRMACPIRPPAAVRQQTSRRQTAAPRSRRVCDDLSTEVKVKPDAELVKLT